MRAADKYPPSRYLTASAAARYLRVHDQKLARYLANGHFPGAVKPGLRKWYIPRAEVAAFAEKLADPAVSLRMPRTYAPKPKDTVRPPLDALLACACWYFNLDRALIIGRSRLRHLVEARQLTADLMVSYGYGVSEVGRALGDRDHSTILFAVTQVDARYQKQRPALRAYVQANLRETSAGVVIAAQVAKVVVRYCRPQDAPAITAYICGALCGLQTYSPRLAALGQAILQHDTALRGRYEALLRELGYEAQAWRLAMHTERRAG